MDDITKDPTTNANGVNDSSTDTSAQPSDNFSNQPVADSTKPNEFTPAEVKVDTEGNLSGETPPQSVTPSSPFAPADFKADNPSTNPMATAPQPQKKKSSMMIIVVAVVIFILLAVAAYFAYNNNKTKTSKAKTTATVASTTQAANTSDVDQTTQAIDKQLNSTNDNKDFASTDLSDTSLGL